MLFCLLVCFSIFPIHVHTIKGYVCEEHENPADYFLDVINRCEKTQKAIKGSKGTGLESLCIALACMVCVYACMCICLCMSVNCSHR